MPVKREASVLRDDLSGLFEELVSYYNLKNNLLEQINQNETQLRYLVRSDNTEGLGILLQADNDLFVRLDAVEFDIQSAIDRICRITGIIKNDFIKYYKEINDDIVKNVILLMKNTKKNMYNLMKDRDNLIEQMEGKLKSIQKDINAINIIRRLKH